MPQDLTNQKILDTYQQLLHLDGGATATDKVVYDGDGTAVGLKVSTSGIDATALKIAGTAITSTAAELNLLDGATVTTAEINLLDGVTATTAELNILDGVTATASEINKLDGASNLVEQTDIGTAPNEIPLNQYLGNLAYQDAENIAGDVGVGGNLLVGTASSTNDYRVDIAPQSAGAGLRLRGGSGGSSFFQFTDSNLNAQWGFLETTSTSLNINHSQIVRFSTAGTERLRITSSGNVGIGTSSPGSKLDVYAPSATAYSASASSPSLVIGNTNSTLATNFSSIQMFTDGNGRGVVNLNALNNATASSADFAIQTRHNGTLAERLRIDSAGNVGIGTSSPSARLDIRNTGGTSDKGIRLQTNAGGNIATFWTTLSDLNIGIAGSHIFTNFDGSAERMRINSSGNVGIGTTAPVANTQLTLSKNNAVGLEFSVDNEFAGGVRIFAYNRSTNVSVPVLNAASTYKWTTLNNADAMSLGTSGNLGVGVASASYRIDARAPNSSLLNLSNTTATSNNTVEAQISSFDGAYWNIISHNASSFKWKTYNGEKMTLTDTGNVGIGTSAPSDKLTVAGNVVATNANYAFYQISSGAVTGQLAANAGGNSLEMRAVSNTSLGFLTNNAERARIDTSGNLLVGTTTLNAKLTVDSTGSGNKTGYYSNTGGANWSQVLNHTNTGTQFYSVFTYPTLSTALGSITGNNTGVAYNTSSDYRLKEDAKPVLNPIDRLMQLKPINFAWKVDGSRTDGFLAHEAQAVVPEAVTGTKDAVDKDGKPEYQGIDQSKLVPLLTAALQELKAELDTVKAELNTLKGN